MTPLVHSQPLSAAAGVPVFLKLECCQPTGSFKLRGIGASCAAAALAGAELLVSSSGGNAGLAVAHAARALGLPATVVLPSTTAAHVRACLASLGATVVVSGSCWDEAHAHAQTLGGALVHPFEGQSTWEGHATLVAEAAAGGQLAAAAAGVPGAARLAAGGPPGALVAAVGGGGLLMGCAIGLRAEGWWPPGDDGGGGAVSGAPAATLLVAAETEGAACLAASLAAGRAVTLDRIASCAASLGARSPARAALDAAAAARKSGRLFSAVVSDADALAACSRFLDDHRVLVEPACGAALAPVYAPGGFGPAGAFAGVDSVLVVVCGGACVDAAGLGALCAQHGVPWPWQR